MNGTVSLHDIRQVVAPLDPILSDPSVWEIIIDRYDRVLVGRGDPVEPVDSPFSSPEELHALVDGLFGLYGIQLDAAHPIGNIGLPDHSRVVAILPPNAVDGPYVVLHRFAGPRLTWEKLIEYNSIPSQALDLLKSAVEARVNMLISGGTAAGKVTVANLLAELAPPTERLIVVEPAYEMRIDHPCVLRLEAGGPAGVSMEDLLAAATHMRPDRLIVGELNGPVAASALQHFACGYNGSLTTIHATSVQDALNRLESYCLMANLGLGIAEIRYLVAAGIQLITYQERLPNGSRKMVEIVELKGVENHRYLLQPLMRYDSESQQFVFSDVAPSWER